MVEMIENLDKAAANLRQMAADINKVLNVKREA